MKQIEQPAITGGTPVREDFLVFGKPAITADDEQEVLDCLRGGWLGYGPRSQEFETEFAKFVGAKHAIGVNSCTAALHLSLILAGVGPGDEVITTPITFPSTANVIVHVGARPVFVDVEPETFNIDPESIAQAITPRTRAIMPVHMAGHPCDMEAIAAIADRHGLAVIEDAAHAIEARYQGRNIGSLSKFTAFSFYVTKNLCTVEGGMLTTDDDESAERARQLRMHGITKEAWSRYTDSGYVHYETVEPGFNYSITDYQAALGLHQLERLNERWRRRQSIVNMYDKAFAQDPRITLPERASEPGDQDAFHLYQILLRPGRLSVDRDKFATAMQQENIGVGIHFTPLHLHKYYRELLGMRRGSLPVAEDVGRRILSLPLSGTLTDQDVSDVINAVEKLTAHYAIQPKSVRVPLSAPASLQERKAA
jgi:dTDP-4-amino-4,6-dideoxygalactose transaminase